MNSRKNGSKASVGFGAVGERSAKGKGIEDSSSGKDTDHADQLSQDMSNVSMGGRDGSWEVFSKKSRNKPVGGVAERSWGSLPTANRVSGNREGGSFNRTQVSEYHRPTGRGNPKQQPPSNRAWETQYMAPAAAPPPLQHGWNWAGRGGSNFSQPKAQEFGKRNLPHDGSFNGYDSDPDEKTTQNVSDDDDDEDDELVDSDECLSDDYESDASQKSHETRKKNKWFKGFFEALDKLTVEEIGELTRQWHCPACHNGPGAIDWYKGLPPLMAHAKTKGSTRVKLHRELAALLEEELRLKGTSVNPAGEVYGKWKGLLETTTDHDIVWPPMVVIMNTLLDKDEKDKWIGMGNQELLDCFSSYSASKARHSYGPQGHRGMSVLIFEGSALGYLEAERLHKHFAEQGTDRDAWERRNRVIFLSGGKRQLYGWMASKRDIDVFNQHSQGKSRLKIEMKSYLEMVVNPMKQMNEDNQQLTWLRNRVVKQEQRSKVLEETFGVVSQKLRETMEENRIVRLRTKMQHEENREEMDYQEKFFAKQMDKICKETEEKEKKYEKLLQEERSKANMYYIDTGSNEDMRLRKEKLERFIASQEKGVEEFVSERDQLIRAHEEKKIEMRQKHHAEELELEKQFDVSLTILMEKYAPSTFEASNNMVS